MEKSPSMIVHPQIPGYCLSVRSCSWEIQPVLQASLITQIIRLLHHPSPLDPPSGALPQRDDLHLPTFPKERHVVRAEGCSCMSINIHNPVPKLFITTDRPPIHCLPAFTGHLVIAAPTGSHIDLSRPCSPLAFLPVWCNNRLFEPQNLDQIGRSSSGTPAASLLVVWGMQSEGELCDAPLIG